MPGNATQLIAVVVILATQEVLVGGQFLRQVDLVAGTAELSRLMQRFQESLLVEAGLRFDE